VGVEVVEHDDQQLVQAVLAGDTHRFNTLVERYQSRVYGLCVSMVGDADMAADVAQEAFISAYRNLPALRGEFRPWIMRIAANACRDVLRSRKRRPTVSIDEDPEDDAPVQQFADQSAGPEEELLRNELQQVLVRALNDIPADQREVVILSDVQGMSYQEIADCVGINIGTVKSRLNRARMHLRAILQAAELFPQIVRPTRDTNGSR